MHRMAFSVIRSSQSLVRPCEQTPIATLDLSEIDSLPVLRSNAQTLHVYRHGEYHQVAKVIKEGLSKALVPYYPLAGRLKESNGNGGGQLQVECSGQGVWFVEAYANCRLDAVNYFDDTVASHSSKHGDLLPSQFPGADGLDLLLQMQVTEFECGGFVIGIKFSHSICDGLGSAQFLNAVSEMARGLKHPSITPVVWKRDFFTNSLPRQQLNLNTTTNSSSVPNYQLGHANIDIYMDQINHLKREIQESAGWSCSSFEVVAAALWICRTTAVIVSDNLKQNAQVKLVFFANCRHLLDPPLPKGFYGNCFFPVTATASSETLAHSSLADVVEMIQEAKAKLPNEFTNYIKLIKEGHQIEDDPFTPALSYETLLISEWGKLGFNQVDFGWGSPEHVIPIQASAIMPAAIVGTLPLPQNGIRLVTWCVEEIHRQNFIHHMMKMMGK
uniref:3'-N-debenzoyl-2'-deoxytaxol N-benzoyltransferase n=1 Tax=Fragaria vesca subsp. vesca TaxID=101020 RepID=UPI0005CAE9EE|nr:PREDICTED: 3'-N-debenzoyl-2'-deoxytaxol N-benzoyltransferase [Fragaria vesca subsp. vesca]